MSLTPFFVARRLTTLLAVLLALASFASAEWKEKVLYSFQGSTDGAWPIGAVVFDKHGNLYGTTQDGGAATCSSTTQCGTVYELSPPAKNGDPWTETVLYIFQGNRTNKNYDGASPFGGLVTDSTGNLYGTTGYGGTGSCQVLGILMGCGTVFELSPPAQKGGAWTETILYSLQGGKDGFLANGDLTFDAAGNLYGATQFGGGKGTSCNIIYGNCGTVFELSPPKKKGGPWTERVLHAFSGDNGDGAMPMSGVTLDKDGVVYGTTYFGGKVTGDCNGGAGGTGCGSVFKLSPPVKKSGHWTEQILHRFQAGSQDGANPLATVIFGPSGDVFGTTFAGPQSGYGVVFEIAKPVGKSQSWKENVIYYFTDGNDGGYPSTGLSFDTVGNLYGTTTGHRGGSVFRLKPPQRKGDLWNVTPLFDFNDLSTGVSPGAPLVLDEKEHLYGTTAQGGSGTGCGYARCGLVFHLAP